MSWAWTAAARSSSGLALSGEAASKNWVPHLRARDRAWFVSARTRAATPAAADGGGGAKGSARTSQMEAPCRYKPTSVSLGSLNALQYFSAIVLASPAGDP